MNKLIAILLLVCLAWLPLHAHAIIVGYGNAPVGGGEFTSFTDDFTNPIDGSALNSTHWNTSTADIQSNQARLTVNNSSLTVQGKEDIYLQPTHSFKISMATNDWQLLLNTGDVLTFRWIIQASGSVGTGNNKLYLECTTTCADGDGGVCYSYANETKLISTNGSGTPSTLKTVSSFDGTANEIRFDNSTSSVNIYLNGSLVSGGPFTVTATLGSTVRVAMYFQSNVVTGNTYGYFDDCIVSVL